MTRSCRLLFCIDAEDDQADFFLGKVMDEISNGADGKRYYIDFKRRNQSLDKSGLGTRTDRTAVLSLMDSAYRFLFAEGNVYLLTYQNKTLSATDFCDSIKLDDLAKIFIARG